MRSAFLFALCAAFILASGCTTNRHDDSIWDYSVVSAADPLKMQKFNQLAGEGWQLVESDPYKGFLFRRAKP